jgi:hypothetical protein
MKKMLIGAALFAAASVPALAQTHVSINIGDPGFYGVIDNRGYARPRVYVSRPVVIERVRYYQDPIYLRVPPKHRHNWGRYCHRYDACGVPVLFVRDDWYRDTYAPRSAYGYRDGYHHQPRPVVVYRDRPQPVVVHKYVYRDGRGDRHHGHGKPRHHGKGHGHGHGHGRH